MEFAGFDVTEDGYRPTQRIINSIRDFPIPKKITDIRSWFGLINQVGYTFSKTKAMEPFRELLSSSREWYWDETMMALFEHSKDEIINLISEGVCAFEPNRTTCLTTDFSKTGLGFVLTQKHCDSPAPHTPNCGATHWKIILASSRFNKDAETRYAPIEGEALAVVWALQKCCIFLLGCPTSL